MTNNELIICSTVIDSDNYSILTTRKIITVEKGIENVQNINGAILKQYDDFKGVNKGPLTFGIIQLLNGTELKYFVETGKVSMIMIHVIKTLTT